MRKTFLAYALPSIGEEEISEVVDTMRSGWLTSGPKVKQFQDDFAKYTGTANAVAVNSCTAALHLTLAALGVGPGDEVIVPTLTFCATANVVVHLGAKPVLTDVNESGHMSAERVSEAITGRTRAIIPVHYAGQACDLNEILQVASAKDIPVVEDAAHAMGAEYHGRKIGCYGRATAFSFYATKNMTTGEGGMIATEDGELAARLRSLSLHGMSRDAWNRYNENGSWFYDVKEPGYKDNMTDIQAAIGIHQLRRLDSFIARRREIAARYSTELAPLTGLRVPEELPDRSHTYHLYPVGLNLDRLEISRSEFIGEMSRNNIGCSVHFIPLHRHSYYQNTFGYSPTDFPCAEKFYASMVSLPVYPKMSDEDTSYVIESVRNIAQKASRHVRAA